MAYSFNGSDQYFFTNRMASTGIVDWPCTFHMRMSWTGTPTVTKMSWTPFLQSSDPWNGIYHGEAGADTGDPLYVNRFGKIAELSSSASAADTWYSLGSRHTSLTVFDLLIDGVIETGGTTSVAFPPAGDEPGHAYVGGRSIDGANFQTSTALEGSVSSLSIWNVVLTDREMTSLAVGCSPLRVRPASLVQYSPLVNTIWLNLLANTRIQRNWFQSSQTSTPGSSVPTRVRHPRSFAM